MKNTEKTMRHKHVGEVSSKYGMCPDQFTEDMKEHERKAELLWNDFVFFMIDHDVDPESFRSLFMRYYEEFVSQPVVPM